MWWPELGFECAETVNSYRSVWGWEWKNIYIISISLPLSLGKNIFVYLCFHCIVLLQEIVCCLYWKGEKRILQYYWLVFGQSRRHSDDFVNHCTLLEIMTVLEKITFITPKSNVQYCLATGNIHLFIYL